MKHYVFWAPEADEELRELISKSEEAESLARRIREIGHWLANDPHEFGESRYENVRVAFVRPLAVQFEILDDPPTVIVLAVWRVDARQ